MTLNREQRTMGTFYPYSDIPLCPSCIHKEEDCTWEGRDVARCPRYARTSELFYQVIGK